MNEAVKIVKIRTYPSTIKTIHLLALCEHGFEKWLIIDSNKLLKILNENLEEILKKAQVE